MSLLLTACSAEPKGSQLTAVDEAMPGGDGGADGTNVSGGQNTPNTGGNSAGASGSGSSNAPGDVCEELVVRATPNEPDMLIVLDRSESMEKDSTSGFPVQTMRWAPAVSAVKQITSELEDVVRFGLMVFPNEASRCSSGLLEVPMQLQAAAPIAMKLDGHKPGGATPLAITLRGAENELLSLGNEPDAVIRDQFVLLITDGAPNCSVTLSSQNAADDADAYKAVDSLLSKGIQTYVVGFDTGGLAVLDEMARRGGTGDTMHRQVSDGASLVAELEEIAKRAVSCTYTLEEPVSDPAYVRVQVDGKSYPLGDQGWKLLDPTTVELEPAACDVLQSGGEHVVAITVECEPVVVI